MFDAQIHLQTLIFKRDIHENTHRKFGWKDFGTDLCVSNKFSCLLQTSTQTGALVLTVLLFLKVLVSPILFLDYELRKEYIIQNYCVNKERPELHCDGKCYLSQRLQQAQAQDEQRATNQFISELFSLETVELTTSFCFTTGDFIVQAEEQANFVYHAQFPSTRGQSIFHPPQNSSHFAA